MSKSIYRSSLLVTDNQNHQFFKQEDTLEIIQCGGFPNILAMKPFFRGMHTEEQNVKQR